MIKRKSSKFAKSKRNDFMIADENITLNKKKT